jgi:NAD(P)-dependent dehydrogenase (short-subunit alcohol dehydrogenase family)
MKDVKDQATAGLPPQHQARQPGQEGPMRPQPDFEPLDGGERLLGKRALITGGDSGIGRAVAVAFAAQGADVAIVYLEEHDDARETQRLIEDRGRSALVLAADVGSAAACRGVVDQVVSALGGLDVLVNNAAEQHPQEAVEDITEEQLLATFRTNVFAQFYLVQAALPHLGAGASIINTASVTAYKGSPHLLDYSATKGAIVAFTRSLSGSLAERGVRVNAVAPGPIWTPLIPSTFSEDEVAGFGEDTPMKRAGQPNEVAGAFVFLASEEARYMTGQVLHPNGGTIVAG